MDEDNGPIETGGVGRLVLFERFKDVIAAEIAAAHFGICIVGMGANTRRETDQLPAYGVTPGSDRIVPPFVGRYKIMRTCGVDAKGMDRSEVVLKICSKAVASNKCAVAADPVGVQQVGVGVGT